MPIKAKLVEPKGDKNWSLQLFGVPGSRYDSNVERANIWYICRVVGERYGARPFLQGDYEDWMMIEFWSGSQNLILEVCMKICEELKIELEI